MMLETRKGMYINSDYIVDLFISHDKEDSHRYCVYADVKYECECTRNLVVILTDSFTEREFVEVLLHSIVRNINKGNIYDNPELLDGDE